MEKTDKTASTAKAENVENTDNEIQDTPSPASTVAEVVSAGDLEKDVERDADADGASSSSHTQTPVARDPNIVDWDGPDDPENPMNWAFSKKFTAIALVSAITFLSALASSVFAPGIQQVMTEFHSSSEELASFIVSVYVIGYCFGPLVIAPLSEIYGRSPLYYVCNVLFVIFNVACAVAPNMPALIIFRLCAGLAGSCPLTIGAGTIADIVPYNKRGKVMASWVFGPLLGPVIGPIAGGYLTQAKGWRWSFWVVVMAAGVVMIFSLIFLRETYAYAILDRKAKKLRKETGNQQIRSALDTGRTPRQVFATAIVRPSKMLLFSPIIFLLSLYMAVIYGYLYLIFTAIPTVFVGEYGFSTGSVGLAYIGLGVGSFAGLIVAGATSDRLVRYLARKNGGNPKPEYRLPLVVFAAAAVPVGLFWFGWTAETKQHWILPIIGNSFLGLGMTISFMAISTYLVDAYGLYAASAVAASTVFRSLGGAVLPLAGRKMFSTLGLGWGSSLLAFIAMAMIPVPLVFIKYGERIRQRNLFDVKF